MYIHAVHLDLGTRKYMLPIQAHVTGLPRVTGEAQDISYGHHRKPAICPAVPVTRLGDHVRNPSCQEDHG